MTDKDTSESRFEPFNFPRHIGVLDLHVRIFFATEEHLCFTKEADDETFHLSQGPFMCQQKLVRKCSSASLTGSTPTNTAHCSAGSLLPAKCN